MTAERPQAALVLLAHGSRDALWHAPVQAIAARIAARAPHLPLRCAYLEWTAPTLAEAIAELHASGCRQIDVLPLFLGLGRHAREDLPLALSALRQRFPDLRLHARPSLGEDDRLLDAVARMALDG